MLTLALAWTCVPALSAAAPARAAQTPEADLVITKSGDESATAGGSITYNIVVTNGGPDAASNLVVTDPLPDYTEFVSAASDSGQVTFANDTLTAHFAELPAYESVAVSLVVSVRSDVPRGTVINNTATVESDAFDPETSGNTATALTFVAGPFPGDLLISEFRFRGPNGAGDEYVELYNNTDSLVQVSASGNSAGWALVGSDGAVRLVIPAGTLIPARGHYLIVNSGGYSLGAYPAGAGSTATGDASYTDDIPDGGGVVLYRTSDPAMFDASHALDAVGFGSASAPYREGSGLASPVAGNVEHAFVRRLRLDTGRPQDTNDNAADFVLVATAGASPPAGAQLGAPGPENTQSPTARARQFTTSLIEPAAAPADSPNRVRTGTGDSGTLSIRRRFTNDTGQPVTRLRFRVVDVTTLGTPVAVGPQADLRLLTSGDMTVTTSRGTFVVQGTMLEQPPLQHAGGGVNTSVTIELPAGGLATDETVAVQFLLNIVKVGRFRFFIIIEALNEQTAEELSLPAEGPPPFLPAGPRERN
jgi:uncharacterized repeat protein (TIGR01451 family)